MKLRYILLKRAIDIVLAMISIVLTMPVMLWISYKIWKYDGFPIIFSQKRVGKDLREFQFYKFRSMVNNAENMLKLWEEENAEEWQEYTRNNFKLKNDKRLNNVGAMIRSTSMDELPQLFNVLRGDMSLVGPRPLLPREKNEYGENLNLYAMTYPGLTGLWQVSGRSQTAFKDRVAFDVLYVENWSFWMDVRIMIKTVHVVFKKTGAC
jgi:lipopolysaccharide/colanic/teichoic acid biosynthesis glycosyltransferase